MDFLREFFFFFFFTLFVKSINFYTSIKIVKVDLFSVSKFERKEILDIFFGNFLWDRNSFYFIMESNFYVLERNYKFILT